MQFDFFGANQDLKLEKATYRSKYRGRKYNNGVVFTLNFISNYYPSSIYRGRLENHSDMTFYEHFSKILGSRMKNNSLEGFSDQFLETKIGDFLQIIDFELLQHHLMFAALFPLKNPKHSIRYNPSKVEELAKVYFAMRKRGFWRYRDLIG